MPAIALETSMPAVLASPPAPRALRAIGRGLFWTLTAALTGLLVVNTLPYYWDADAMPFVVEKGAVAASPAWRTAFFLHITGAMACIVAAILLFSRRLLQTRPAVHRALGWTYVLSALLAVVPAGFVLVPAAKGGVLVQAGFVAVGVSMAATTAVGFALVLRRDFVRHRAWMVRSYAIASTAISSRAIYVALTAFAVPTAYEIGLWASIGVSVLVAESWIERNLPRRAPPRARVVHPAAGPSSVVAAGVSPSSPAIPIP